MYCSAFPGMPLPPGLPELPYPPHFFSELQGERIWYKVQLLSVDCQNVKTAGRILRKSLPPQIIFCCPYNAPLLCRRYGLLRPAEPPAAPVFHLDKYKISALVRDQINLAGAAVKILLYYFIAAFRQIPRRKLLLQSAERPTAERRAARLLPGRWYFSLSCFRCWLPPFLPPLLPFGISLRRIAFFCRLPLAAFTPVFLSPHCFFLQASADSFHSGLFPVLSASAFPNLLLNPVEAIHKHQHLRHNLVQFRRNKIPHLQP